MKIELNHRQDKKYLDDLTGALEISKNNYCRDEYDYWTLKGKRGFIDTDSEYWYVRLECETPLLWRRVKNSLQFMEIWQDGEDEGALRLQRYPTAVESQKIRKYLGFRKSTKLSEESKKILLERLGNGR